MSALAAHPIWQEGEGSLLAHPGGAPAGATGRATRGLAAALALAVTAAAAPAPAFADELEYEPWPHAAVTAGIGAAVGVEVLLRDQLAPTTCTFCGGNAFDRGITEALAWQHHRTATALSDAGLILMPSTAVIYGFVAGGWEDGAIDALVFGEAFAINFLTTELIKFAVARERPMVLYLPMEDPKVSRKPEDWYVSFPSGHSSGAFVSVAAMATIADLRGRDPTAIWLAGLPLAASVAYFRVAGYHHWTTDVLAGAALGTVIGIAVPRLLHGPGGLGSGSSDDETTQGLRLPLLRFGGAW